MESIYLQGSEDVRAAANRMHEAAAQINHAANETASALFQHQQFMDDWLERYACLLTDFENNMKENKSSG